MLKLRAVWQQTEVAGRNAAVLNSHFFSSYLSPFPHPHLLGVLTPLIDLLLTGLTYCPLKSYLKTWGLRNWIQKQRAAATSRQRNPQGHWVWMAVDGEFLCCIKRQIRFVKLHDMTPVLDPLYVVQVGKQEEVKHKKLFILRKWKMLLA